MLIKKGDLIAKPNFAVKTPLSLYVAKLFALPLAHFYLHSPAIGQTHYLAKFLMFLNQYLYTINMLAASNS